MTLRLCYYRGIVVPALVYVARVRLFSARTVNFESILEIFFESERNFCESFFFLGGRSFIIFKIRKCRENSMARRVDEKGWVIIKIRRFDFKDLPEALS